MPGSEGSGELDPRSDSSVVYSNPKYSNMGLNMDSNPFFPDLNLCSDSDSESRYLFERNGIRMSRFEY